MIRLTLFAAAAYVSCRLAKAIIAENTERLLLPAPPLGDRSSKNKSLALDLERSAQNG